MAIKLKQLVEIDMPVEAGMDPRLQRAQMQRRSGRRGRSRVSTGEWEVAVAARVSSVAAWKRIAQVKPGSVLGKAPRGGFIVTGRIEADRLSAARRAPGVLSLKASQPLRPQLAQTAESMRVRPDLLPAGVKPRGGAGVIVGIIDAGGDFAHPNFRREDGRTRLLALWHQDGDTRRGDDVLYGRSYSRAQIDRALRSRNPYRSLGYRPQEEPSGKGAHGTHVMDIAAGNGRGTRQAGVAPEADLIFVDISMADAARAGKLAFGYFMGDSVLMLEALAYIFRRAGRRPCVVNLSLGSHGGPHDGSSLVEQGIDALLRDRPNRAVVIAAGNSQIDRAHAQGTIAGRAGKSLTWEVTQAGGELECWYHGGLLQVTLVGPDGREFRPVCPGSHATFGIGRKPYLFISNRLRDPNNGLNQVNLWLEAGLPAGGWSVRLRSLSDAPLRWHAWIERAAPDDQATFRKPRASHTLGSISTGFQSIVVGAYDAHRKGFPLSPKSSAGTTRDGRRKPELSAPGHAVLAARSRLRSRLVPRSGTSMAAPAVSGLVALIYAQARRAGKSLTIGRLRKKLLRHLDRSPPAGRAWHPRYGFGRASGKALRK